MRIAYLCTDLGVPVAGYHGCSVHVRQVADAFVTLGHQVTVLCTERGDPAAGTCKAEIRHLAPSGLAEVACWLLDSEPCVADRQMQWDLRALLYNMWLEPAALAILQEQRPDFLYERYSMFGCAGVDLARRLNVPLILEVNAPLCLEQGVCETFTLRSTAEYLEGEILRAADGIVVVSDWLRDWVTSRGVEPGRVHVLPNGVDSAMFGPDGTGSAVRRRHGLEGAPVIGFVGSFQPWHDAAGLLRVFAQLQRSRKELRLLLVGEGPLRGELEKAAQQLGIIDAVVFTGGVAHHEVPEHVAAMDVAVAPFVRREDHLYGSPMKLFEYMAAARPTVSAALGQVEAVVEHGRTGWLYSPGDDAGLLEALRTVLDHPDEAQRVGRAARERVLREYTWEGIAAKIVSLAAELAGQSAVGSKQ